MDILKLYQDFGIRHFPEGESKHAATGWVQVNCPFCDDHSDHLGYNLERGFFNCWRCGFHPIYQTIAELLQVSVSEAMHIIDQYRGIERHAMLPPKSDADKKIKLKRYALEFPSVTGPLALRHKTYLANRGFDPDKLEQVWGLLGTGPISSLKTDNKKIDYRHRILAPIVWDDIQVSYQTRDVTGKHPLKYISCPQEREMIHHKSILYGNQHFWKNKIGICVEGITDVWRLGPHAFATFGTGYTEEQVRVIAKNFRGVAIVFDRERTAQHAAIKLANELQFRGTRSLVFPPPDTDPGDMNQKGADEFVARILDILNKKYNG